MANASAAELWIAVEVLERELEGRWPDGEARKRKESTSAFRRLEAEGMGDQLRRDENPSPAIKPVLTMAFLPPGLGGFLGMRLPLIPGVPESSNLLIRGIKVAFTEAAFSALDGEESKGILAALAETMARCRYHRGRFDDLLATMKVRRDAVGGPVMADWVAAPPLIWEGLAFLGASRTVIDILVYIAARRAGKSVSSASKWEANEALWPKYEVGGTPPTRFDVPEILALRGLGEKWFEELNTYRNVVYHRGWGAQSYGFFTRADAAQESLLPQYNALLLPDLASLAERKLHHEWTHNDGSRLDELVERTEIGLTNVLQSIFTHTWGCTIPQPGTAEHPSCALTLAMPAMIEFEHLTTIAFFTSRSAALRYSEYPYPLHGARSS